MRRDRGPAPKGSGKSRGKGMKGKGMKGFKTGANCLALGQPPVPLGRRQPHDGPDVTKFGSPKSTDQHDDSSSMTLGTFAEHVDGDDGAGSVYSCSSSGEEYDDEDMMSPKESPKESPAQESQDDIAALELQLTKVKEELGKLHAAGAAAVAAPVVCKAEQPEQERKPPQPKRHPRAPRPRGSVAECKTECAAAMHDPYF